MAIKASFIVVPISPIVVPAPSFVIAKAGNQDFHHSHKSSELGACVLGAVWISACAEMTMGKAEMTMGRAEMRMGRALN